MLGVLLAAGAALGWGISDFLGGLRSRRIAMLAVLLVSQVTALGLLAATVATLGEPPPPGRYLVFAMISGLAEGMGVAALYRGLAVGTMSIVAPIAAIAPALPLVAGILLGEVPTPLQFAGLVLAVAGVVLTSIRKGPADVDGQKTASSTVYGLLSALGFGIFFVALDAASAGSIPWALLVARSSAVAALVLTAALGRFRLEVPRRDLPLLAFIGVLVVAADAVYATATTVGLLGVVAVIGALHTVVTMGLARIVLREHMQRLQQFGVVACIAGVLMLSVGP